MTYQHTQAGYQQIAIALAVGMAIALVAESAALLAAMVAMTVATFTLFGSLSTTVDGAAVRVHFGPLPLIRKRVALAQICSARAVRNKWWYGIGMRWIPRGRLWNVWGYDAVELEFTNGKRFRIGTDEPQALVDALRQAGVQA